MPESKSRKAADNKRRQAAKDSRAEERAAKKRHVASPTSRQWVVPAFVTVGLVGVMWLVVYYITTSLSIDVPFMTSLGGWNVIIGMSGMAGAFILATLWK